MEIKAHGIVYRGWLAGADEDTVYLKAETGWVTLPMGAVSAIKQEKEGRWVIKAVPGEPGESPKEKKSGRKYSRKDIDALHRGNDNREWPEWNDEEPEINDD